MMLGDGPHESGLAPHLDGVRVGAGPDQQIGHRFVVPVRGPGQSGRAIRLPRVDVGPRFTGEPTAA
jgi:hypothetical protein